MGYLLSCCDMIYGLLADLVLALHAFFVAFVVLGGLVALRWRRAVFVHIPCALWGAWVALAGWICPLTPLEVSLRQRAGEGATPAASSSNTSFRSYTPAV